MIRKKYIIIDPMGLHARPASILTKELNKHKAEARIIYKEKRANLKSIMSIMALGVPSGEEISLEIEGDSENEIIGNLEKILKDNFVI